jgi:hypothetical protein
MATTVPPEMQHRHAVRILVVIEQRIPTGSFVAATGLDQSHAKGEKPDEW